MARRSSIEALPQEVRDRIGILRREGASIDAIMQALDDVAVSRSALGPHTQKLDTVLARLERTRLMAETIAKRIGTSDLVAGRVNVQILHGLLNELLNELLIAMDGDAPPNAKDIDTLARALANLTKAQKVTLDAETSLRTDMKQTLETAVERGDMRQETAAEARRILGLDAL